MEKEQVIKALKVCANYQGFGDCDKCPAREGCDNENSFLEKEALSLIREQEKRIEELENICESYSLQYGTAMDKEVFLKKERAATVRKLAERLKDRYEFECNADEDNALYYVDLCEWVERIEKELLEENT